MYTAARSPNSQIVFSCSSEVLSCCACCDAHLSRRTRKGESFCYQLEIAKLVKDSQSGTKIIKVMKWIEEIENRKVPISVKEAAKLYGDSTSGFYQKIRRGEVPGVFRDPGRPRGRIKICPAEFAAWLRARVAAGNQCSKGKKSAPTNALNVGSDPQGRPETNGAGQKKEVSRLAG